MRTRRSFGSAAVGVLAACGLSLLLASPALAHAEIEVEPAQAGATDAVVTVFPESHNHHAGVTQVEVFLPEGISGSDVTLLEGPDGWEFTPAEDSYTLSGDELEIDVSPLHSIQVRQLPNESEIYFRILVSYSDGTVDRWIELPTEDNPDPSNAAAGATLTAAASPTPEVTTPAPDPTTPAPDPTEQTDEVTAEESGGGQGPLIAGIVAVVALVAIGIGYALMRRRRAANPPEGS